MEILHSKTKNRFTEQNSFLALELTQSHVMMSAHTNDTVNVQKT